MNADCFCCYCCAGQEQQGQTACPSTWSPVSHSFITTCSSVCVCVKHLREHILGLQWRDFIAFIHVLKFKMLWCWPWWSIDLRCGSWMCLVWLVALHSSSLSPYFLSPLFCRLLTKSITYVLKNCDVNPCLLWVDTQEKFSEMKYLYFLYLIYSVNYKITLLHFL